MGKVKNFVKIVGDGYNQFGTRVALSRVLAYPYASGWQNHFTEYLRSRHDDLILQYLKEKYWYVIKKYQHSKNSLKNDQKENNIWTFWYQGEDQAPEIVKKILQSIKENSGGKKVIVLDKNNIADYIKISDHIMEKVNNQTISLTHFSDILRVELLKKYGGLWIDSTMLVMDIIPDEIFQGTMWSMKKKCYKKSDNRYTWYWTGFLFYAKRETVLFQFLSEFFYEYWKREDYLIEYLLIDYAISLAYNYIPQVRKDINLIPVTKHDYYALESLINQRYNAKQWELIKKILPFQKLSYKHQYKKEENGQKSFYGFLMGKDGGVICKKTVSIAMAVYNGEKYLRDQLDSLRLQKRQPDEVIIQDDGSTDDTCSLVRQYIKEHRLEKQGWKFYENKKNLGFRLNFFSCIQKTSGDMIFLCDQDDIWKENKIEYMLKIMEKHPEIKVLNTAVELIDEEGKKRTYEVKKGCCNANFIEKDIKPEKLEKFEVDYLLESNISPGCTVCFTDEIRKQLLHYKQAYKGVLLEHDYLVNIIGALNDGTFFWNKELTQYRIHGGNTIGVKDFNSRGLGVKNERLEQGRNWIKHYKEFIYYICMIDKKQEKYRKEIKRCTNELKYHVFRTRGLENKNILIYGKSLPYRIRNYGAKVSMKMLMVDILYILGIRYH